MSRESKRYVEFVRTIAIRKMRMAAQRKALQEVRKDGILRKMPTIIIPAGLRAWKEAQEAAKKIPARDKLLAAVASAKARRAQENKKHAQEAQRRSIDGIVEHARSSLSRKSDPALK